MREGTTNAGKKETRQFDQLLDKSVKQGNTGAKDVEARTTPRVHRTKGKKTK